MYFLSGRADVYQIGVYTALHQKIKDSTAHCAEFFSSLVCTVQCWSALDCRRVVSKERERMIREKTRPPLPDKALRCNVMQDSQLIERDRVHCTAMYQGERQGTTMYQGATE